MIIVVADVADLWALERAGVMNARYHVLGGTLSPLDGIGPDDLAIDALVSRAARSGRSRRSCWRSTPRSTARPPRITSPTCCTGADVQVTRLAHGVPVGGELDYLDDGTLSPRSAAARRFEASVSGLSSPGLIRA